MRKLKLFSLALMALFATNLWSAELTAHTPGTYEKSVATGGYGCTLTTIEEGTGAGMFEVYYFSALNKYGTTTDVYGGGTKQQYRLMCADDDSEYQLINTNGTGAFTASCDWIEMAYTVTGFSKTDYPFSDAIDEFFAIAPNGGNSDITKTCYVKPKQGDVLTLKVSGYVEFAILGNDNGSSKYMTITVDGGTPKSWKSNTLSRRSVELTTGEHTIVVACVGNSANAFYGFSLKLPAGTKHHVTYELNGGSGTTPTQADVAEGSKFTLHDGTTGITAPTGMVFAGWNDGTTTYNGGTQYTMGTDDVTFTAQWATSYDVKFFQGYGEPDVQIGETQSIGEGAFAIAPADPERDGYAFMGWSFDATIANVVNVAEYPITAETNFTAIWLHHYAVTYNKGAYGSGTIEAGEKIEGIAFTLSAERFTRENYVQVGWALTDGGAQAYSLGGSYTADADIELFPVWMEAEVYTATFTYDSENPVPPVGWTFSTGNHGATSSSVDYNGVFGTTCPAPDSIHNDNYIAFAKNAGSYAMYDLGSAKRIIAVNGIFNVGSGNPRTFTIDYLAADGNTVLHTITINHPKDNNWGRDVVNDMDNVDDVRYIKIKGMASDQSWIIMQAFSVTYVSKRTITFAAGEGEGNMDAIQYYSGDEVTLPDCTFDAPDGKKFAAWTSDDVTISDGKFTMPAKNVTVTATYATLYNITISDGIQNGEVTADKAKAAAGETVTLTVTPDAEYVATNVSYNGTTITPVNDVYSFTMPAQAVTVTATFAKSSTALDNTEVGAKAVKTLKNGLLIIEKNGVRYNMLGERVQ